MDLEAESDEARLLAALTTGPKWRIVEVAQSGLAPRPGPYTLWAEDCFRYVGIAYRDPAETSNPQARGVPGRLGTYAAARLISDLTIAVLTRFVMPELTPEELAAYGTGRAKRS